MHDTESNSYGMGEKKLSIYLAGVVACVVLTLVAFWAAMSPSLGKWQAIAIVYIAACIQFLVQLTCFLRLNVKTKESRSNVMIFIFTGIIMLCIILGSLWIMWNLHYRMS